MLFRPILLVCAALPAAAQTTVTIDSPLDGDTVAGTVVIEGTSTGVGNGRVTISIDGGPFQLAQGTDAWDFVWESGTVPDGQHTIRARAKSCFTCTPSFDEIVVDVANGGGAGVQEFTYLSSVDGEELVSKLWLPSGYDPNAGPVPLVIHLHGGGGIGQISADMQAELDARGWIGIAPDGREWGLFGGACNWRHSAAYVNHPDPNVGPGEQDIFDAIDWALANHDIDTSRIYLTGFSMGGRGTYMIGLKNPDVFAAIAPMGPAAEMFEVWVRRTNPGDCKEGMTGGPPGTSDFVDTLHHATSARFLLENAFNVPVFHGHGLLDGVASNNPSVSEYLHGWHIVNDTSFDACHDAPDFCFGHTPTLSELNARHPEGYDYAYMFTPVAHVTDGRWLAGTPMDTNLFGTEDPLAPGNLLGIYDFFERRTLETNPSTVVYKTYEDEHRGAFWAEILTAAPWSTQPAGVRATRDMANNEFVVELARAAEVRLDVAGAGLQLGATSPLAVVLAPLAEPVFDPALDATGESLAPVLALEATELAGATVLVDGLVLPPPRVTTDATGVTIDPIPSNDARLVMVHVAETYCAGGVNSVGTVASLAQSGTASVARNDFGLRTEGAAPGQFGIHFYGFSEAAAPLGDGALCVGGPLYRLPSPIALDATGSGQRAVDLTAEPAHAGAGEIAPGDTVRFQFWYRDPGATSGSNTSDALRVTFLP